MGKDTFWSSEQCSPRSIERTRGLKTVTDILEKAIIQHRPMAARLHIAANALDSVVEGAIICTRDDRIISVNRAFTRITGYEAEEALGQTLDILLSEREPVTSHFEIYTAVREHGYWSGDLWSRRKNGESYVQSRSVSTVRNEAEGTIHFIIVFSDVTKQKQDEKQLAYLAHHDTLTWPLNRTQLERQNLKEHV
jgi:PAS domain S-box-containing protein